LCAITQPVGPGVGLVQRPIVKIQYVR